MLASSGITQEPHNRNETIKDTLRKVGIDPEVYRLAIVPNAHGKLEQIDLFSYSPRQRVFLDPKSYVKFYLTTRRARHQLIRPNENSISQSSFNKNHPTRLWIHGWDHSQSAIVNVNIINEYIKNGEYNCIVVDWTTGARESPL